MASPTTSSILPPAVQQQLSMKLLARPMPDLIHTTLGYPITMDQQTRGHTTQTMSIKTYRLHQYRSETVLLTHQRSYFKRLILMRA